ncbi:hypothetical protein HZS_1487 [Henneguya salminicola]|nr:hypothetical protein HZS_1487 [Henneguya salminicola]
MKTYYRYDVVDLPVGIVNSNDCNVIYCDRILIGPNKKEHRSCVICGALENVILWNTKHSKSILVLANEKSVATRISYHISSQVACGYSNGDVRIYNLVENSAPLVLKGHSSAISALEFDIEPNRLVSGSLDTYIIIWDILNECGLYRLKGHNGPITACKFLKTCNILITSSKDTFIKLWDLDSQHCFATLQGHDSEVWDFVVFNNETGLIAATSSDELKFWKLEHQTKQYDRKRVQNSQSINFKVFSNCFEVGYSH